MPANQSPLGKKSAYINQYAPELLFPIPRKIKRDEIHVPTPLPFHGYDLWNAFEVSWLNMRGKPVVAIAEIIFPADSEFLIESKSLKLYFNSLNQSRFDDEKTVAAIISRDLSKASNASVSTKIQLINDHLLSIEHLNGFCLDHLDIDVTEYEPRANLLTTENQQVNEIVHSHLLKSNCLVTHQPDWGSVEINYAGQKINHANLLKYIISFRDHNEFHEQCVERIFMDILTHCQPSELTVYARYTRRGGLDINPFRSTNPDYFVRNPRLIRQ
jgi:7-cyano-7-deazaguanine reductase